MTFHEFEKYFSKQDRADRYYNYLLILISVVGSLFLFYKVEFTNWYEIKSLEVGNVAPILLIRISYVFLFLISSYGFWRVPQLYKPTLIRCSLSNEDKFKVLRQLEMLLNLKKLNYSNNIFEFKYYGLFYNPFLVRIFISEESYFMNVQQVASGGGFIDFGNSERVKRKIVKIIKKECIKRNPKN